MKRIFYVTLVLIICSLKVSAQQKIYDKQLNWVYANHPNLLIYRDTVYKGAKEFKTLFYRTDDKELWKLYDKHQSNKIWGNILNTVGALSTTAGVIVLSSHDDKTAGWLLIGGGIGCMATGSYLILQGQKNLLKAVLLFNQKYNKPSLGLGVGQQQAGLVYKF